MKIFNLQHNTSGKETGAVQKLLQFVSTPFLNNDVGGTFQLTIIDPVCYDLPSKKRLFLLSSKHIDAM